MSPAEDPGIAKQVRKEKESMRMLSTGVPAPIAVADPLGASSSKSNPFAFPEYKAPVKVTGSVSSPPGPIEEDCQVPLSESGSEPSRPSSPMDIDIPDGLRDQWKDYLR